MTGSRKTRDAVSAKLKKAQERSDGLGATGKLSDAARNRQNRRVADRIEKRGKGINPQKKS